MNFAGGLLFSIAVISAGGEEARHWAYEVPVKVAVSGHPVDGLLAKVREGKGTERAGLASPRNWAERAAITLTGLPPSAEQVARIEANPDSATWEALIDELLASPTYGERWARHWMDAMRGDLSLYPVAGVL